MQPHIQAMQGYQPGEQPPAGTTLVKLNTNENPYPPSPRVIAAIRAEIEAGTAPCAQLRLYSDPSATAFRHEAAKLAGLPDDYVICGNGSDELLSLVFRAFVGAGDRVVYAQPTYSLYETLAQIQAAQLVVHDYPADFALPEALKDDTAKLVIVASPNSPSGTLYTVSELGQLASALKNGVLLVDEAYIAFADGSSALPLLETHDNVIVLRTLSKSYSLAGMRLGILYAHPQIVEGLWKIKDSYNLDRLAIAAGAAALSDDDWMQHNAKKVRASRERLTAALKQLGLDVLPSHANFVFARFPDAATAAAEYRALRNDGILVRYFDKPLLDNGLRIGVGTDEEVDLVLASLRRRR